VRQYSEYEATTAVWTQCIVQKLGVMIPIKETVIGNHSAIVKTHVKVRLVICYNSTMKCFILL
jgi:hypothetical protein